jgi:RNA polymerase sigma-70 factor (ECF subfamily)
VTAAVANALTIADRSDVVPAFSREDPEVEQLVRASVAGDREAFGELVSRHERVVFRTALAALGRREDAEDATQEAFLIAWQKLPGFRRDATFRTWLLTIAWRKALDKRRVRGHWWRRTQTAFPEAEVLDPLDLVAGSAPDPERSALSRDLAMRVRAEIARLSPKLRDALVLAASGEHSYPEIAVMLRIPLGTVKWRVSEARRLVNERLP